MVERKKEVRLLKEVRLVHGNFATLLRMSFILDLNAAPTLKVLISLCKAVWEKEGSRSFEKIITVNEPGPSKKKLRGR